MIKIYLYMNACIDGRVVRVVATPGGCEFKARPNIVNFNIAKMRLKTSYIPFKIRVPS